ncbi:DUF2207 domain-containing protein [Aerococcaceae bacterium DSM 111176]|nr:DUF2207 domain-containing protein [Aerococcaceae bacterium DSM 111176]
MALKRLPKQLCFILLSLFMVTVSILPISAQDISFSITDLNIEANIEADGDVLFQDAYTYDVDYFNGALVTVDPGESVLDDYRVGVKRPGDSEITYLTEEYTGENGTYQVSRDNQGFTTFRILYPLEDETVDFVIEYRLTELVVNYADTALFSRVIVPNNLEETVDVNARINLPSEVTNPNDFRVWGYGTPAGEIFPVSENGTSYIDVQADNVSSNQFVEVMSLFPTSLTPQNTNTVDTPMKDQIIEQEEERVEADRRAYEQNQQWMSVGMALVALLGGGSVIWGFIYYFRKRRELNPTPAHVPEHVYHLPAELTPAVMATTVFRETPTADDFSATILDLARKGYITIEELKEKKRGIFRTGYDSTLQITPKVQKNDPKMLELQVHETAVFDYLYEDGGPLTLNEIETKIKTSTSYRKRQNRLWTKFKSQVEIKGEQERGAIPRAQNTALFFLGIGMVGSIIGTILILILFSSYLNGMWIGILLGVAALLVILALVGIILVSSRPIRTHEQDKMSKEWNGFKNMLEDIGNMNMREVASLPLWDEYLVYAVSLGVADKVLEAMNEQYGVEEIAELSMPSDIYLNYYLITSLMRTSVDQSIRSAAPQTSSSGGFKGDNSGGFGGGFSGGSFGGGGGGGSAGGF